MSSDLVETVRLLSTFTGTNLTSTLARIEDDVRGLTADRTQAFLAEACVERKVLGAAAEMKRIAGQVNVTIHALGILLCLPHILEEGEHVEYVSLGAGNAGRQFDLETNLRVAEFKFITWRGGAESIRQNSIFKDYFLLAEAPVPKRKYLYLLGIQHALKFFNGGRSISSVLSRGDKVQKLFNQRFGDKYAKTRDYFLAHQRAVTIVDVSDWLGELRDLPVTQVTEDASM